jgi:hypothetical protein
MIANIPRIQCVLNFLKGIDHLEDPDVDGRIILKWILKEIGYDYVDLIQLTQYRPT